MLVIGAGFLGRALALRLAAGGARVTLLSPHANATEWPAEIDTISGRQEDAALLADLLGEHDTVIHAAWGTTPGSSAGRPAVEASLGLNPFLVFLETLQRFPEVRLLFLSSGGTVYGNPQHLPVAEDTPLRPRSCHGAGKASAEFFLGTQRTASTIVLRPSNIYGPGQPLRGGFGVIPRLLACAAQDEPFELWGDGSQVRDYLFIDDFAEAVCCLLKHPAAQGVYNIGSSAGTSLIDLVGIVSGVTGRAIRVELLPERGGDVERIFLDALRLRCETGWTPRTSLSEGVARAWRAFHSFEQ